MALEKADCQIETKSVFVTSGEIILSYLEEGEYILAETKTLSGYELPLGQWLLTVDEEGELTIQSRGESPPALKKETVDGAVVFRLPNYRTFVLLNTGANWKLIMTILGMIPISSTGLYIIMDRKKKNLADIGYN